MLSLGDTGQACHLSSSVSLVLYQLIFSLNIFLGFLYVCGLPNLSPAIKTRKSLGDTDLEFDPGSLLGLWTCLSFPTSLVPCTLIKGIFLARNTQVGCVKANWHGGWLCQGKHGDWELLVFEGLGEGGEPSERKLRIKHIQNTIHVSTRSFCYGRSGTVSGEQTRLN